MTPEVVAHHPIPEDLNALLEGLGYTPILKAESYTRFQRTLSTRNEPSGGHRKGAERLTYANQVLFTPEQAAQLLGVGRTTVYRLINEGELRSVTIGRCRRIGAADLGRFVDTLGQPDSKKVG